MAARLAGSRARKPPRNRESNARSPLTGRRQIRGHTEGMGSTDTEERGTRPARRASDAETLIRLAEMRVAHLCPSDASAPPTAHPRRSLHYRNRRLPSLCGSLGSRHDQLRFQSRPCAQDGLMGVRSQMGISLSRVIALMTEEVLDLIQGNALLYQPRGTRMAHCVGWVVRDRPQLPILVYALRAIHGRPPCLPTPVSVAKQPSGATFRNSGEHHPATITSVHMPRNGFKHVIRQWHFTSTLGALRVFLYLRCRVDLDDE